METDLSDLNGPYLSMIGNMLPAGRYTASLLTAVVETSNSGNPQVVWTLEVENPSNSQKHLVKKFTQLSKDKMYWLFLELNLLEETVTDLNDLQEVLKSLTGTRVAIQIDYSPGYGYPIPKFARLISKPHRVYTGFGENSLNFEEDDPLPFF